MKQDTPEEMLAKIDAFNAKVRDLVYSIPDEIEEIPDDIKNQIELIKKEKEDYIKNYIKSVMPNTMIVDKAVEYKGQPPFTYYDETNIYCLDMLANLQENLTSQAFLDAYHSGHLYVFDRLFVNLCFDNEDDAYDFYDDNLWDLLPYKYFYQYTYAGNRAIERYIDECKQGLHDKKGSLEKTISSYVDELNPFDDVFEFETQTRGTLYRYRIKL